MLAVQDLHSSQFSLHDTMHSRKRFRHSHLLLQRWILWRRRNVLRMPDLLAVRHESYPLHRQHHNRYVDMHVQRRILRQWPGLQPLLVCHSRTDDQELCCWQHSERPCMHLQHRLLRQRSLMLAVQDLHSSQLRLSDTLHNWERY